jgi:hypothetical protein
MDVVVLCTAIRDWTIAQIPGGAEELDQLWHAERDARHWAADGDGATS